MSTSPDSYANITRRPSRNPYFDEKLGEAPSLRMMQIPSGTFIMGSPADEIDRFEAESPQHKVTVATFFMAKHPITQAQWRFVAGLKQVNLELDPDPSHFKGENRPVEQVNWYEAVEFCDRLTQATSRAYRLPSEAEWEYACRAGTVTPFHFGETITTDLANYRGTDEEDIDLSGSYGNGPKGEYREKTTPVGYFELANTYGLCDMHGNVWEWCADHWHNSYEGAPTDGSTWLSDDEAANRVIRGGCWVNLPWDCRSATRFDDRPVDRNSQIGFRVICTAPKTLQSPTR
jgi:formylglycine-generating enzyme required for sulfatase activity